MPTTVLSLDGGGIRGIISATILAGLEERLDGPLADHVDLVAGSSTGGILALGLVLPDASGRPKHTAEDIVGFYREQGPKIFHRPWHHVLTSLAGLAEERYPSQPIEAVLKRFFGDHRLSEVDPATMPELLIPSYDLRGRTPYFFKTVRAREDPDRRDHPFWEVARATSAAPTYFEPVKVEVPGQPQPRVLIDGGVVVNNPAMSALAEVLSHHPPGTRGSLDDVLVVSIGTGSGHEPYTFEEVRGWGLASWAKPLLESMFDGVSDATDYHLEHLLGHGHAPSADQPAYHRFQASLSWRWPQDHSLPSQAMDDASKPNLQALEDLGRHVVETHAETLDGLAEQLSAAR